MWQSGVVSLSRRGGRMSRRRRLGTLLALAGLVAAVSAAVPAANGSTGHAAAATVVPNVPVETVFHHIDAADGTYLGANYVQPTAPGKYPGVVLISAWSGGAVQDLLPAEYLAQKGFVVVDYATRGFSESKGESDVAGPVDIGDLSTVITWMLANTKADPDEVGCGGLSYGAGICLLGAAMDKRIKAVGAISPWSDISRAFYPNNTRNMIVGTGLGVTGQTNGKLNAQAQQFFTDFFNGTNTAANIAYLKQRSPMTYLSALNANKPAILMESAWNDSAFSTDQNADFFTAYQGPKHYEARPGDHFILEAPGAVGLPDVEFEELDSWYEAYLQHSDTTAASQPPILYHARSEHGSLPTQYAQSFATLGSHSMKLGLGPTTGLIEPTGTLTSTLSTGWSRTITDGLNLAGSGGIPLFTFDLESLTGTPPTVSFPFINRANVAIWQGQPLPSGAELRGASTLHITIVPKSASGTIVAYLYDDGGAAVQWQIEREPFSWSGATPGVPMTIDLKFSPNAYSIPAGHRVSLEIAPQDLNYSDANPANGQIQFTSPAGNPSYLTVPTQ